ncbi:MAG: restriction endonuclease subunit S [Solirubrobacterales bacterium]
MSELPTEWRYVQLEELLEPGTLTYGIVQPGQNDGGGVPIVRVKDLEGGRVNTDSPLRVSHLVEAAYARSRVRQCYVLLSLVGSVGTCAVADHNLDGWNLARAVGLLRPLSDVGPLWISHCLRGPAAQAFIGQVVNTTVQTTLNLGDLKRVPIPLPPTNERNAIAGILGALDDKIESNRRLADVVDEIVRAEVAFGASGGREVAVADLVTLVRTTVQPKSVPTTTRYVGLEHMPRGRIVLDSWGVAEGLGSGKAVFSPGDILFGKLRPYFKKVGLAPQVGGVCSTDILVLRPTEPDLTAVALAVLASDEFIEFASNAASGTRMPRASWNHMRTYTVRSPTRAVSAQLAALLGPLLAAAQRGVEESVVLAELRDALLPELLSGRLRVPVAEELVEAAT